MEDICKEAILSPYKVDDIDVKIADEISRHIRHCKQICDVGFGNTLLAETLVKHNPDVNYIGIDLDPICVSDAQKKSLGKNISFLAGQVNKINLPLIDCFVVSRVAHHMSMEEMETTLHNMMVHVMQCGKLVIVDSIRDYTNRPQHYLYLPFYFIANTYQYLSSHKIDCNFIGDAKVNKYWVLELDVLKTRAKYSLKFID